MAKTKNKKQITRKLLHKYRLVILNEDTFEERLALKLTRLNVFLITSFFAVFLVSFTAILIAFTPLREFIPGYSSTALNNKAKALQFKTDSINNVLAINERYYQSISNALKGNFDPELLIKDSIRIQSNKLNDPELKASLEDSILRAKVDDTDKYNVIEVSENDYDFILFPPVNGTISQSYSLNEKHYAVDVAVTKNTPVKATADGVVVFSEWTSETGYVLVIAHKNELLSIYKHNSSLTKSQGDGVKAGEVVAMAGNTGEFSTGPHLHFELWSNGFPINPENFIDFK